MLSIWVCEHGWRQNSVITLNVNPFVSPQEDEEPSVLSSSTRKTFSRPACPANRRLPSRWANRSPTSSSSNTSSPSTTPVVPPSFPLQKHTSSFSYSHGFHIETVIIWAHCLCVFEAKRSLQWYLLNYTFSLSLSPFCIYQIQTEKCFSWVHQLSRRMYSMWHPE